MVRGDYVLNELNEKLEYCGGEVNYTTSKMVRGDYVLNELNEKFKYCGGEKSVVRETSEWG